MGNTVVIIADPDPRWPEMFAQEEARIREALPRSLVTGVEHVGSTAVPDLAAKPIIDILVGVTSLKDGEQAAPLLTAIGYEDRGEFGIPGRLFFEKRENGTVRTHHLHMAEPGGEFWTDELLFRDYLRVHPDEARRYEQLKRDMARQHRFERTEYTASKSEYILSVLDKARKEQEKQ